MEWWGIFATTEISPNFGHNSSRLQDLDGPSGGGARRIDWDNGPNVGLWHFPEAKQTTSDLGVKRPHQQRGGTAESDRGCVKTLEAVVGTQR